MTELSGSGHARRVARVAASAATLLVICATLCAGSALATVGGEYTVNGLPTGSYKVLYTAGGEVGGNYLPEYYAGKATFGEATEVAVTAPTQTSGIDVSLSAGGQISGKVTSAVSLGGTPLPGVFVCAAKGIEELPEECAETNASGEYTIVALQTGEYIISFSSFEGGYLTQYYNGKFSENKAEFVAVSAGTTKSGINAEMQTPATVPGGKIKGKVVAAGTETPLEGVEVCAFEEEAFTEQCAFTSTSGQYTLGGLSPGEYEVSFFDQQNGYQPQLYKEKSFSEIPNLVKVAEGETKEKIDAKLKKGATISGTVVSAEGEQPVAQAFVCARGTSIFGGCAVTNEAGKYQISGLPSGEYKVEFIPFSETIYEAQWYKEKASSETAEPVTVVAPEPVTKIDGKLLIAGQISGKVTAEVGGAPIANISVCTQFGSCARTSATGEYDIVGLTAGSYKLSFAPTREGQNYVRQTRAEAVEVAKATKVPNIDAMLQPGGQISGVVSSAATAARLEGVVACVYTTPEDKLVRCARTHANKEPEKPQEPPKEPPKEPVKEAPKPEPNSAFGQAKAPSFNAKTATITFSFTVAQAGTFHWSLFFKNADVGFADALGVGQGALYGGGAPVAAGAAHKCAKGQIRHKGKCVRLLVPFGSGSQSVAAGTVQIKVKAGSKALKALKAGGTLHVSGTFTFQSSLGGTPIAHTVSAVVREPKKHKKH